MNSKIRLIIENEKLGQKEFAAKLGIQPSAISHYLSGRNKPNLDVVQRILKAFPNINYEWLILDSGPMYKQISDSQEVNKPDLFNYNQEEKFPQKAVNSESQPTSPISQINHIDNLLKQPIAISKEIVRIVVYYSDNTYSDFFSS